MTAWTWPAYVAVLLGTLLFLAVFVPAVAWQYRRYGRPSPVRLVALAAVAVYVVALGAYTLLPLPEGDLVAWCEAHAARANRQPLAFVDDVRRETQGLGLARTLTSVAALQVVFNVVLFVPWGLAWRGMLGRGVLSATASGAAVSLLVEVTQYTGVFGLLPCAYRVGDVDDLLTNTAGAFLGAVLAPVVLRWLPSSRSLTAARALPRPITVPRRWWAMVVDAALFWALGTAAVVAWRVITVLADGELRVDPTTEVLLGGVLPLVVVFVLPPLLGSGASLGQRTVWLAPRWPDGSGHVGRRVARAWVTGGAWAGLSVLADVPQVAETLADVAATASGVVAVVAVVAVPLTRARGLSAVLTGADVVDVRAAP